MFEHITPFAGDPILSLNEAYQADPRADRINLSIGIYFDESGRLPVLEAVRQAEMQLAAENAPKPYLPMEGLPELRDAVQSLLFGDGHAALQERRIATIQTVGSSGGLKVGAEFIRQWLPGSGVWISDPTWDNHHSIFEGAGVATASYPYYAASGGVDFEAMLAALRSLPPRSVVLLHACCHNPTGVDLSADQWRLLVPVFRNGGLVPYLDMAYQGFGDGIEEDAFAVRLLADAGLRFMVANSFSKSMSLYGERAGALSVACRDAEEASRVLGQLKFTVRRNYSSPPLHAARLAARVLRDPVLRRCWEDELAAMRERIHAMRRQLHDALVRQMPGRDFGYLLTQRGMFSYTGLGAAQADRLREEFGIYIVRSGRICVSGLNRRNVERVAQAMAAVLRQDCPADADAVAVG